MVSQAKAEVFYPDSDGQPIADNTKQFRWIVTIKENLELFRGSFGVAPCANRADVFVAGLLWYPIEGDNTIRQAPDAMVAIGRPKGDRGSYQQWLEDNIPPQVVFEILSPGNRLAGNAKKYKFYNLYGVEEYYVYDPDDNELIGWVRSDNFLDVIEEMSGWVSPRLQIRFQLTPDTLEIYRPDGERFRSFTEIDYLRDQERQRAHQAEQKAARLAERLRQMGIDPDAL